HDIGLIAGRRKIGTDVTTEPLLTLAGIAMALEHPLQDWRHRLAPSLPGEGDALAHSIEELVLGFPRPTSPELSTHGVAHLGPLDLDDEHGGKHQFPDLNPTKVRVNVRVTLFDIRIEDQLLGADHVGMEVGIRLRESLWVSNSYRRS